MSIVDVDFRKWPDTRHYRWPRMHLLGEDRYGVWLYGPEHTPYVRPSGKHEVWGRHIALVPRHAWFTAVWNERWEPEIYCDIATPARWTPGHARLIDLDLDVARWRCGRVEILDEDEFDQHRVALGYPSDVTATALATAHRLAAWLRQRVEPFGAASSYWWART